jgi:hypothetical protein
MKFDVFVQEVFYKTIEISSNDVSKVISMVGLDIEKGLVPNFDNTKNQNIKIMPNGSTVDPPANDPPANDPPANDPNDPSNYIPGSRITSNDGTVQKLDKRKSEKRK